jgi:hypothetical protein
MQVMGNKLTNAVLKRIRAREEDSPALSFNEGSGTHRDIGRRISVREAQFSDFPGVSALGKRQGQGPDSIENWERLWRSNPAIRDGNAPARIGWVLEASGEVVGFLGGIPLLYEYEGKTLIASATCRFAVDPAYRALSHLLMSSFLRQKDVDLLLNTTATPSAGKIMRALQATQVPQRHYETVLFWVLNARQFSKAVSKKMGLHASIRTPVSGFGALLMKAEGTVRGRKPRLRAEQYRVEARSIDELGSEFDRFCSDCAHNTYRLTARRSAEVLRWHFCPPENRRSACALCAYAGNRLVGYVVVRGEMDEKTSLLRSIVADLLVEQDAPEIVRSLIRAAYKCADENGSHILELMGFPSAIRDAVMTWNPYSRQYPSCPFFFKARDKAIQEKLLSENAWYASQFDGDATLWP